MKKTIYVCDVCPTEASSEEEYRENFHPTDDKEFSKQIEGNIGVNNRNFAITVNIDSDEVVHICKTCYSNILKSVLGEAILKKS